MQNLSSFANATVPRTTRYWGRFGDFGARERRALHVCAQKPAQTAAITLVVPATVP